MEKTAPAPCPVCDSGRVTDCLRIEQVPIYCNVLYATREEALQAPRGDIDLGFCQDCGHLNNRSFEPARVDYATDYENSLHYSKRFQQYALSLAQDLIERHKLHGKTVIEIACGNGDFLELLCTLGNNRGIGFDPSHVPDRQRHESGVDLTFIRDYYGEAYRDYQADLVCCRHALEHMSQPQDFLRTLRESIGDRPTAVFFEVPDALFTLRDLAIWDLIYEHCGYFTEHSLREIFRRSGFSVVKTNPEFGGQFIGIHARAAAKGAAGIPEPQGPDSALLETVERFSSHYHTKVENWKKTMQSLRREGRRTILWGAGSKGVSFANILQAGEEISCLVDLNPLKQGRYVAGTGHRIQAPESLARLKPDVVIVMNPLYTDEIRQQLGEMGLDPRIIADLPAPKRASQ